MKFLLLSYHCPQAPTEAEIAELVQGHVVLHRELAAAGVLVSSAYLADPRQATAVRVRGGTPTVTDGPFLAAPEQLTAYYLIDCSPERALEIAARLPCGTHGGVEVRPVDEGMTRAVRGD